MSWQCQLQSVVVVAAVVIRSTKFIIECLSYVFSFFFGNLYSKRHRYCTYLVIYQMCQNVQTNQIIMIRYELCWHIMLLFIISFIHLAPFVRLVSNFFIFPLFYPFIFLVAMASTNESYRSAIKYWEHQDMVSFHQDKDKKEDFTALKPFKF